MQKRSDEFISMLKKEHPKETILIVCHDGIRANLISSVLGKNIPWMDIKNERIHEFEIK